MKVHLKITVLDRLIEKFSQARRDRREVDYVTVTPNEYHELRDDRRVMDYLSYPQPTFMPGGEAIADMTMRVRDFETTHPSRSSYQPKYRVASRETFMGKPLFVVPEWCRE